MIEVPREADEHILVILMAVAKADKKILQSEVDFIHGFFDRRLRVCTERLRSIRTQVARYQVAEIAEERLSAALELIPSAAHDLLFQHAVELAIIDHNLDAEERGRLLEIGKAFGLPHNRIQQSLHEAVQRREDAFSLLCVSPEDEWETIEAAYEEQQNRYDPVQLSSLGVAFQNLALERLERINWAYTTLREIFQPHETPKETQARLDLPEKPASEAETQSTGLQLDTLDLPPSLQRRLDRYDVSTEGKLCSLLARDYVKGFHSKTRSLFEHLLMCLKKSRSDTGDFQIELFQNFFPQAPQMYPKKVPNSKEQLPEESEETDPEVIWSSIPSILQHFFARREREWDILCRRLGLAGRTIETLEAIGESYELTRERVRQIEVKAKKRVRELLLMGETKKHTLHPAFHTVCQSVYSAVSESLPESVATFEHYERTLTETLNFSPSGEGSLLVLFQEWAGQRLWTEDERIYVFRNHRSADIKIFFEGFKTIQQLTRSQPEPLSKTHLARALSKVEKKLHCSLDCLLALCPEVEHREDGTLAAPMWALSRSDQAHRVLAQVGKPLHFEEIAARVNELSPERPSEVRNLTNQISHDPRFAPIGRSGQWALTEWEQETGTVKEVIEAVLKEASEPLSTEEVTKRVQSRRECSEKSVLIYLSDEASFRRVGHDLYTFESDAEASDAWNRETVGKYIEEFFARSFHHSVPFPRLVEYLMAKCDIKDREASGILRHHPAVIRERFGNDCLASLRVKWRSYKPGPRQRAKPTLQDRVDDLLRKRLKVDPEVELNAIMHELTQQTGSPRSALYAYVENSPCCEKFDRDGVRWVRAVDAPAPGQASGEKNSFSTSP